MVVFSAVENDGVALEDVFGAGVPEEAFAKFVRDDAGLHDREVEQIAAQNDESRVLLERLIERADHLAVRGLEQGVAEVAAANGDPVAMQFSSVLELPKNGGDAAGPVEALAEKLAGRLHVQDQRQRETVFDPILSGDLHPGVAGHGGDMGLGVRGAADDRGQGDGVQEGFARQDVERPKVLIGHFDNALTCPVGHLAAFTIGRWNGGAPRQGQAQRLGDGVHR
ncbi:hypothetical protein D3C73_959920 [compost metagenome]